MLSFVLAPLGVKVPGQYPNEIAYAYGGTGVYSKPFDYQFNQHGEQGLYYDTQLGDVNGIPTDAELATSYVDYTPVASGWVNSAEGVYWPAPWVPPSGWNAAGNGPYGAPISLHGSGYLADSGSMVVTPIDSDSTDVPAGVDPSSAIAAVIDAQNARIFKLTIISTTVVALSALVSTYRMIRQLRRDEKRDQLLMSKIKGADFDTDED